MRALNKNTLGQTFKFDCDRYLRFRLATPDEKTYIGFQKKYDIREKGLQLVKAEGRRWETEKYQDLLTVVGEQDIECAPIRDAVGKLLKCEKVESLTTIFNRPVPPLVVIEGEFEAPQNITPALQEAYQLFDLSPVKVRPDLIWIRPYQPGEPLLQSSQQVPEFQLHIIDVKMAAEPSLRHFTEVTYYALALAAWLDEKGLANRYAVSARGFVWPGSHDPNEFKNFYNKAVSNNDSNPIQQALLQTLKEVPYEVYTMHVRDFFQNRLLRVLNQKVDQTNWHVSPKCHLCDYVEHCRKEAEETDHLSRIPWLTSGQAKLLRENGIQTTKNLADAIRDNTQGWLAAMKTSHQFKSEAAVLQARATALQTEEPQPVPGRKSALMPRWSDLNVYLTIHFDMGTGVTFAMGAMKVYFPPNRTEGESPETEVRTFIVDRVDSFNTDTEKARLVEFVRTVCSWLDDLAAYNEKVDKNQRKSAHIFFWDQLELKQLKRMLMRHLNDPNVTEVVEEMVKFFPPDNYLPDPDVFKSQPGTIVKEVFRTIFGLPLAHDYTLLDVANVFYPSKLADGTAYRHSLPYGFHFPMTDQIPFERAYEIWQDRVVLTKKNGDLYTREEIRDGIKKAVEVRLKVLNDLVYRVRVNHGDMLILKKAPFVIPYTVQTKIPETARQLIAFTKLNLAVEELENRQNRALPVEEKEARFISIRGLSPAQGVFFDQVVAELRGQRKFATRELLPMTFSEDSRDSRIKEGEFLLAISNEDVPLDLDVPWSRHLGLSFDDASKLLEDNGFDDPKRLVKAPISRLLQVDIIKLDTTAAPPYLVLSPSEPAYFRFAQNIGLIDITRPTILDPIFRDLKSKQVEEVLKAIGGDIPPMKRKARRKTNTPQ